MRYDRARGSLDRHATYVAAAYIAGAARGQRSAGRLRTATATQARTAQLCRNSPFGPAGLEAHRMAYMGAACDACT